MVVATPDIYQVPLTSDVEFIILASDGLWDYMKRFPFFFPSFPIQSYAFMIQGYVQSLHVDQCFADAAQMWLVS